MAQPTSEWREKVGGREEEAGRRGEERNERRGRKETCDYVKRQSKRVIKKGEVHKVREKQKKGAWKWCMAVGLQTHPSPAQRQK